MKKITIPVLCCIASMAGLAQTVTILSNDHKVSMRGLSAVDENIIWVSGSRGTVARSINGGKTWNWMQVPGFEKSDFRDIEAFDRNTAVIMGIDTPAVILRTTDGGQHWKKVYENKTAGMFMDAMDFAGNHGTVIGDPVGGRFFVAQTKDAGNSWTDLPFDQRPLSDSGEGCFASSGTNIRMLPGNHYGFISGGMHARFFGERPAVELPLLQGSESYGANSLAVMETTKGKARLIVVGGDFKRDTLREKNCAISTDGGMTWVPAATPPFGYRSCVEFIDQSRMVTCGTSGIDLSTDAGLNWKNISRESFHVCRKAKKGKVIFLAGNGKIARLNW